MSRRYDWLIVGAGFTGAVVAERLARLEVQGEATAAAVERIERRLEDGS